MYVLVKLLLNIHRKALIWSCQERNRRRGRETDKQRDRDRKSMKCYFLFLVQLHVQTEYNCLNEVLSENT